MSRPNQPSIMLSVVRGQMRNRQIDRLNRNGVVRVNDAVWTRDPAVIKRIFKGIKQKGQNANGKTFSMKWGKEFEWAHFRENKAVLGGGTEFAPAVICKPCNVYYSENPTAKMRNQNRFAVSVSLIKVDGFKPPPQKSAYLSHEKSMNHRVALGEAPDADHTVFASIYKDNLFAVSAEYHPFNMYFLDHFKSE